MDLQKTVSAEKITGVATIPSGACTGTLVASDPNDWKTAKCSPEREVDETGSMASRFEAEGWTVAVVALAILVAALQ